MDLKKPIQRLFDDEKAVSPVIGVILMVAITVILAAVIASFVLGLGDNLNSTAPTATISVSDASPDVASSGTYDALVITHDGGDSISYANAKIVIRNADSNAHLATYEQGWDSDTTGALTANYNGGDWATDEEAFSTGDTIVINDDVDHANTPSLGGEVKVQVIHTPSGNSIASSTVTVE